MSSPTPTLPREPHPDAQFLTYHPDHNSSDGIDYHPHPSRSLKVSSERKHIVDCITRLYSGSASEDDMQVYTQNAVYDDPLSYCDNRYKIAGQWYGIPLIFSPSRTLAAEIVASTPQELNFKLRQEYTPRLLPTPVAVNSLVSLGIEDVDGVEKVAYHKDMWNAKDYSHQGLGMLCKKLNGDYLPNVTKPPESL